MNMWDIEDDDTKQMTG